MSNGLIGFSSKILNWLFSCQMNRNAKSRVVMASYRSMWSARNLGQKSMAGSGLTNVKCCSLQLDGPGIFQYYWWLKIKRLNLMHRKHMGSMLCLFCKSKTHKTFLQSIPFLTPYPPPLLQGHDHYSVTIKMTDLPHLKLLDCSWEGHKETRNKNKKADTMRQSITSRSSLNTYYFCTNTTYRTDPTPRRHPTFLFLSWHDTRFPGHLGRWYTWH